jgi:outer membrane protein assembly factor BamB
VGHFIIKTRKIEKNITAVDCETNTEEWSQTLQYGLYGEISARGDSLFVIRQVSETGGVDEVNGLVALDKNSGEIKWGYNPDAVLSSGPTVRDGVVYIPDESGSIHAVHADSGQQKWLFIPQEIDPRDRSTLRPVVSDTLVCSAYVGLRDGISFSLNIESGTFQQSYPSAGTSLVLSDGSLYFSGSRLIKMNAESGETEWMTAAEEAEDQRPSVPGEFREGGIAGVPSVTGGTVYYPYTDTDQIRYLFASDMETGELQWGYKFGNSNISPPIIVEDTVYTSADGLYAFDAASGEVLSEGDVGTSYFQLLFADGAIFGLERSKENPVITGFKPPDVEPTTTSTTTSSRTPTPTSASTSPRDQTATSEPETTTPTESSGPGLGIVSGALGISGWIATKHYQSKFGNGEN